MFHVKHDLKLDPAFEASDGFEYAPADAHNIGGPGPRSSPNRASILHPVAWCSRQLAVGAREEQSEPRDIFRQVKRCPKLSGCIRKRGCQSQTTPRRVVARAGPNEGAAESASSLVLWGGRRSRARATRRGHGRGMIDCGVIRATNLPTLFDQSVCPVSRETAEGDARQHGDGCQSYDSSRRTGCSNPGRGWQMHFTERGPQRRPRVGSLHRRIVWDP